MEKTQIKKIIAKLSEVNGLDNVKLLSEHDRDIILNMEDEENLGVQECIDRQFTLVLTHDSSFRKPEGKIVREAEGRIIFPGVPFSEVKAKKVISSSPCKDVHDYVVKRFDLELKNEATLLIGFDL
jgi:hypothetical protein